MLVDNIVTQIGKSHVDRMFGLLVNQIAGVEDTMGTGVGGISNILLELDVMRRHFRRNAKIQTTDDVVEMPLTHVDVVVSTPSKWQQCVNQNNVANIVTDLGTPLCPQKHSVPHTHEARGAELVHIIFVEDDASSYSGDNKAIGNGRSHT